MLISMAKKRGSEQLARDRGSSQVIGKRHRSGHKAGESSRQGNRASLEEETLKAILKKIKEEVKEELKKELREEVKEDVKEELNEEVKKERRRRKKNFMGLSKELEELKEKAALERPDDGSLARRSELHESSQLKLRITSTVNSVVYKRKPIETNDGKCVVVNMFDGTDQIAPDHHLSSAEVELVILNGAFNGAAKERWSKQEFEAQIVNQKKKKDNQECEPLITKSIFKLSRGSCSHKDASIMGNSNRAEFRLGVRLVGHATERVLEGISNPFKVQEYKTKDIAKHDIPSVDSEIWRLHRIARNSKACSEIEKQGIDTVGRLLISYYENEQNLLVILRGSYHRDADVDAIIDHAKECEDGLCSYKEGDTTLFFKQRETLVGVQMSDCSYFGRDISLLPESKKDVVRGLESNAREHKAAWRLDYKMENGRPKPWLPKGSGSSVPTSAQMQEKVPTTDDRTRPLLNQLQPQGIVYPPSDSQESEYFCWNSLPNLTNVQGEAGLGLGNTGEPSAERNSVMAYVPTTDDRTRPLLDQLQPQGYPLLNQLQPQGYTYPPFDYQVYAPFFGYGIVFHCFKSSSLMEKLGPLPSRKFEGNDASHLTALLHYKSTYVFM